MIFFGSPCLARPLEGKPRGGSQAMSEVPSKAPSMVAPRPQVPLGNDGKPWEFEGRFTPPPPWSGEKPHGDKCIQIKKNMGHTHTHRHKVGF